MIYFKIITQILTGVSGILALFLDYKWHDKRKSIFKKSRNVLILLSIISLAAGIIVTLNDENDKNSEVASLKGKLDSAQNTLSYIKANSDSLKIQLHPFIDLAKKYFPGISEKDALDSLSKRIDILDIEVKKGRQETETLGYNLDIEKKTIKSFEVTVSIEFSGKWNDTPYPLWYQSPSPRTYLRWTDKSQKKPDIEFSASRINFQTINENTGLFKNTFAVQPGSFPLGELTDVLQDYDGVSFWMLFTSPASLLDSKILLAKVDVVFYINGSKAGELHQRPNSVSDYGEAIKKIPPGQQMNITPTIAITEKPVNVFHMKL